jgi:hypothetical protein
MLNLQIFSLSPSSPQVFRSSSPTPRPRISHPFSQFPRHATKTLPAPDKRGEEHPLTRAQSVMSMSACTSPFALLEDVVMAEIELSSLSEPLDDNSLDPPEVQSTISRALKLPGKMSFPNHHQMLHHRSALGHSKVFPIGGILIIHLSL